MKNERYLIKLYKLFNQYMAYRKKLPSWLQIRHDRDFSSLLLRSRTPLVSIHLQLSITKVMKIILLEI